MKLKNKARISSENVKKEPPKKLNPFEVHVNRSKHQVLGRKLKSDRGLPGISKNKALIKRKNTLLQEYKMKDRNNQFIDQRIGEKNTSMTEDDRIMARFAAERRRMFNKKAMFNLSDSEVLTHKGQTLSEIERFEDTRSDEEEDDEGRKSSGALKGKFVENAHFGGGLFTKNKQDRESLIDELINESKKRKAERQRNKEETLEATENLDEDWKTLGMIVTSTKDTGDLNSQKKDQYDIVMRQLKFEPHGQPSERIKTDDEVAKEDKERLEKLEKERLKQLREIEANKYGSHKSADDLDDGFEDLNDDFTENDLTNQNKDTNSNSPSESCSEVESESDTEKENEEEEEDEKGEEDFNESEFKCSEKAKDEKEIQRISPSLGEMETEERNGIPSDVEEAEDSAVESSDEDCAMDDFTDLMPSVSDETTSSSNKNKFSSQSKILENITAKKECSELETQVELDLPYVLNIPDTYESFVDLLKNHSIKQQNIIFDRLIKNNHPSLEPGNKKKMLKLATYVISLVSKEDITWESLSMLVTEFTILKDFNKEECLKLLVDSISTKLEDFDSNTPPLHGAKYLTWYIMLFLRPQGLDVLIPVSKPALSLACRLVSGTHHVTLRLLCCYLILQDAKSSSIVYPEAITCLHSCINTCTSTSNSIFKKPDNILKLENNFKTQPSVKDMTPDNFRLHLTGLNEDEEGSVKILHCSVVLLSDFVKAYRKYPQCKLIFKPIYTSVSNIKADAYPLAVKNEIMELQMQLQVLSFASLPPLVKPSKKPKALRQYEPSFHTVTVGRFQRGLPAEIQEEQKLLHKYKHELKGAMRELRRDRVFLANVKLREKASSDEQRMRKVKEIYGSAATQQGELRSLKRKK